MRYFLFLFLLIIISCSNQTPESRRVKETIGKELKLGMFKNIYFKGDTISLSYFLDKYKYKSIVYLLDECTPCYDKYIKWHKEMEKFEAYYDYSILFVISGKYVDDFFNNVDTVEYVEHNFAIVMDPNFIYPDRNTEVPEWILEYSLLVDENNMIRMIGSPFANSEKLKRFKEIVEQ